MRNKIIFGASILALVLVFVFAGSYYKKRQAENLSFMAQENAAVFVRDHSQILGNEDAKIYIIEFMDPACETCAAFYPFVKKMMAASSGKIKLVLRYAPFHNGAEYFVKILEASKKQGKYWETLKVMYGSQRYWASHHDPQPEKIWQFLPMAGLDIEMLKKDMNDPVIEKIIAQDLADAKTLNVRKTPGFFVNGRPLQDFGYQQLQNLVLSELAAHYPN